jgi:hypothetical protein
MKFLKNIFKKKENKFVDNSNNPLAYKFAQGESCDVMANTYGEFGKEATNPIPVNGPKGEILYLNNLRTNKGEPILFHRIAYQEVAGIDEAVDIFEITNSNGNIWDIIFLHMYHPRNSNVSPKHFSLTNSNSIFANLPVGLGITNWTDDFPNGLSNVVDNFYGNIAPVSKVITNMTKNTEFIRPISHLTNLVNLNSANHFFEKLCKDISEYYPDNYLINLLTQKNLRLQLVGIKAVQLRKKIEVNLLNAFCKSVIHHRDVTFLNEILQSIPKFDKEAHKALKDINNQLMWDIYSGSNFLEMMTETFREISIPYLLQTRSNPDCPTKLANKIDRIIEEITYR